MGLVSQAVNGIFGGVSQQAEALRQPNQAAEQINFKSDIIGGIKRRSPTKFQFNLVSSPADENTLMKPFKDTEGNKYFLYFHKNAITPLEVYHEDGTLCTITYEGTTKDYLDIIEPKRNIKVVVMGDYNMIVNTTKIVNMDNTSGVTQEAYALYYCKQAIRYVTYSLGGISYTTPKVSETTLQCSSSIVCQELITALGTIQDVTLEHLDNGNSSVIRISGSQSYIDGLTQSDSYGNTISFLLKGKAKKLEDLPHRAKDGDIMEITGQKEDQFANYWLKWIDEDNQWKECTSPDLYNKFDPTTMPHQLIRKTLYDFEFSAGSTDETLEDAYTIWDSRQVGDIDSAPEPSFVGNGIKDLCFFKNCFGMVSGRNTILSRPNGFFNFFPKTATDVLDTDPLDMTVGSAGVTNLIHVIPYEENLLLFSKEGGQFIISSGGENFTASSAAPNLTTDYPCDELCKPVMLGGDIFFASTSGEHTRIREYFVTSDSQVNDAADITAHCPTYLEANIYSMVTSSNAEMLYCASGNNLNTLFVYHYYRVGTERPMSAWFKYSFSFEILGITSFDDDKLHLLIRRGTSISQEILDDTINEDWLLDRQVLNPPMSLLDTGETEVEIPYDDVSESFIVITEDSQGHIAVFPKLIATTVTVGETCKIIVSEDITGATKVILGKTFESVYTFSEWFIRNSEGTGILQGRLGIKTLTLDLQETGDFNLVVKPQYRTERLQNYTGKSIGGVLIGSRHVSSGQKKFTIGAQSKDTEIKIVSNSVLPCNVSSASFEGFFTLRNQLT